MSKYILYFNELSIHANFLPGAGDYHWKESAANFYDTISETQKLTSDFSIGIMPGLLDLSVAGKPFRVHISENLTRTQYQRLLVKFRPLVIGDQALCHEVKFQNLSATGLLLANLSGQSGCGSWAASLLLPNTPWDDRNLQIEMFSLGEDGDIACSSTMAINHLASPVHVTSWRRELLDWGKVVLSSCEVDMLREHPIAMYSGPQEHGPPHVHLLSSRSDHNTIAKYRIDIFERQKGPPTWDTPMKEWVIRYQDQLLKSWGRCQEGGLPYALEKAN
jgi:hypothetical protein